MAQPKARDRFTLFLEAPYMTVNSHTRLDVDPAGDFITKPVVSDGNLEATHIQMQALTQNIRYTIDGTQASSTVGFQLASGSITTVPVPNLGVSVFEEVAGAIVQYQWLG